MPRQWLSFRSEETGAPKRRTAIGGTSRRDAYVYVPYGQDKLAKGDGVYCVAVDKGELLFFSRVIVARMAEDPEHDESLDVGGKERPGAKTTAWSTPRRSMSWCTWTPTVKSTRCPATQLGAYLATTSRDA